MIRIRYRDSSAFSPGLHAAAERHGRTTTLYLLSGLTAPERRSALRRLRLSARMGHCPRLPAAPLAIALLADGIRTAIGRAGAVLRLHPAGSTVPVMVLSGGAIAFLLFSTVSIRVLPSPQTDAQSWTSAGARSSHGRAAGLAGPGDPGLPGPGSGSKPLTQPGPGGSSSPRSAGADSDGDGDGDQDSWVGSRGGQGTGTRTGTSGGTGTSTSGGTGTGTGGGTGTTLSEHAGPTPAAAGRPPRERPRRPPPRRPPPRRNPRPAPRRAPAPSA